MACLARDCFEHAHQRLPGRPHCSLAAYRFRAVRQAEAYSTIARTASRLPCPRIPGCWRDSERSSCCMDDSCCLGGAHTCPCLSEGTFRRSLGSVICPAQQPHQSDLKDATRPCGHCPSPSSGSGPLSYCSVHASASADSTRVVRPASSELPESALGSCPTPGAFGSAVGCWQRCRRLSAAFGSSSASCSCACLRSLLLSCLRDLKPSKSCRGSDCATLLRLFGALHPCVAGCEHSEPSYDPRPCLLAGEVCYCVCPCYLEMGPGKSAACAEQSLALKRGGCLRSLG